MSKIRKLSVILLLAVLLLNGCALRTVDQMYALPKRSAQYNDLQQAIDSAMTDLEYSAPLSGENRQTVQMADLNGDSEDEYLVFTRESSGNSLRILIFSRTEESCRLMQTIESSGSAFELVEYVDIDGVPGLELVVGCRVSDQILGYVSVYTFSSGESRQLMAANYSKFVTTDLDEDGVSELMVIAPGESEEENASAVLFRYDAGIVERSREAGLSENVDNIKRIMVSRLYNGAPAVYVASAVEESAIITDVFALKNGRFSNISLSNESGTSVQTLRNYYVYADDIDNDGVLELPSLIPMTSVEENTHASTQQLIRWYALKLNGSEEDKMYTFHNFESGWFLKLDDDWASRVSVVQQSSSFFFYIWDEKFLTAERFLTIDSLIGSDRERSAAEDGRFLLYKTDGVVYAAKLEAVAQELGLDAESLTDNFQPIHMDWKTGET